jgi:hypothetical protein
MTEIGQNCPYMALSHNIFAFGENVVIRWGTGSSLHASAVYFALFSYGFEVTVRDLGDKTLELGVSVMGSVVVVPTVVAREVLVTSPEVEKWASSHKEDRLTT